MESLKIGDIVSVKMTYAVQESYYDETGRFCVRKNKGETVKFFSDRVKGFYPGNGVITASCGIVPAGDIYAASESDIQNVNRADFLIAQMYAQGEKLMNVLVEPEFI